ncbi:MAG: DEAD/DEAH box helicase [Epsilonproteobacteria bacterium]|nr:DEAD/DEAH box helicase [Campylobacterota bacterium]
MIQFYIGNVYTTFKTSDNKILKAMYEMLSYEPKGVKFAARRLNIKWTKRGSFLDTHNMRFLTGFLPSIIRALKTFDAKFEIYDTRKDPVGSIGDYSLHGITLYDYQERTLNDFIKAKRGIAKLATGGGKTETCIAITKCLNIPTLFLTHRVNLLHQTKRRFEQRLPEMKNKIGVIGDSVFEPNFITIGTVQTIHSMIKSNPEKILPLLKQYQMLIIDEAHRSGAKQFWETASYCENAYYRLALTATPFMKGNAEDNMYLLGITGEICTEITNGELIERGIIAKPFFKFFTIDTPKDIKKLSNWHDIYDAGISENETRNKIIVNQTKQLRDMGKTIMIITTKVAHGKTLEKMISDSGVQCAFLSGSTHTDVREKMLNDLDKGKLECLIATNIFDEGISINGINAIILAAGTKSAPALFQRTGRGLRVKDDGNYCIIIDFIDTQHKKLLEHSMKRYNLIKNEKGFHIL